MDYENVPAAAFGHALSGISVNLLVRDVRAEAAFLAAVFDMQAHRLSADFAIMLHAGQPFQLHSDATLRRCSRCCPDPGRAAQASNCACMGPDPDLAAALADFPDAMLLQQPTVKWGHGLREAVVLCPFGYAWVPSRPDPIQVLKR